VNRQPYLSRLAETLACERGIALVMSLGAMTVIGMAGASALLYSTQNSGSSARSSVDNGALAVAEAGINDAVSVLSNPSNDPTNPSLLPATTESYNGGTATYTGTYDAATMTWKLTATGSFRNPTGPSALPVTRTVSAVVPVTANNQPTQALQFQGWNYLVETRTGNPCDMTLSSGVTTSASLYAFGNLCLGSSSHETGGAVEVKGGLTVGSGATVGSSSTPIPRADVALGCAGHPCSSSDGVYATTLTQTPPTLTPPTLSWDYWYANAAPGPKHPCDTSSGTVPVFDNDSIRNNSVTPVFSLTPSTSYSCLVGPPGNPTGQLSWDATNHVLTVHGTIFVDGQVKIDNGQIDRYTGQGVLYASGAVPIMNGTKMCAVVSGTDCDFSTNAWDPNTNLFTIVSNGNGGTSVLAGASIQLGCLDRFQGALYGTNTVYFSSGTSPAKQQGPIVASNIIFSSNTLSYQFKALQSVPAGMPGQTVNSVRVNPPQSFTY
jgi:Tfp pilus assembly protein PilX